MIDLSRDGDVTVLRMHAGENRFDPDLIRAWNDALDEVEKAEGPRALVTTGSGKFYSNGLDLDYMMSGECSSPDEYLAGVLGIIRRLLVFPTITVAVMNGHAFGAGAQLALAHDYRVMRTERGYFCMPEIDMHAPLHPGMTAIIQARLPHQTAHEVITTGKRYGAEEALDRRIVDHAVPGDEVLAKAVAIAAGFTTKAHPAMATLKAGMYTRTLEALEAKLGL